MGTIVWKLSNNWGISLEHWAWICKAGPTITGTKVTTWILNGRSIYEEKSLVLEILWCKAPRLGAIENVWLKPSKVCTPCPGGIKMKANMLEVLLATQ